MYTRVETRSGHLDYVLSGSSGSDLHLHYKIASRFCIGSCVLTMTYDSDQSDELSMLNGDDGTVSLQDWL